MGKVTYPSKTIVNVITGRYDPTQNMEWERFRQQTIGDSSMLTAKDKVEDWRTRGDSFGHRMRCGDADRKGEN